MCPDLGLARSHATERVARGKPSTWLPRGRLVETAYPGVVLVLAESIHDAKHLSLWNSLARFRSFRLANCLELSIYLHIGLLIQRSRDRESI